ncbi:MAG TPA: hypothetical protein VGP22_02635 [Albitalea sp.]|jgi:hypothetical protein|nr:hypothetical protein [Albitalea sp.]
MKKLIAMTLVAGCMLATGAAQAGNVFWSVGINLPPIGTVVSNAPVYTQPAPVYVEPAPVYYEPAPVYYAPAPVYYVPAPRAIYRRAPVVYAPPAYYRPAPVVYRTGWHPYRQDGQWRDRDRDRDGRRDEYGSSQRNGRWVPADPRRQHHDR